MGTDTLLLYGSIYGWMLFTGIGLPPIPEEAGILYAAGLSTHEHETGVWWPFAWLLTSLGILSADLVLYGVGRKWGLKLFELKWVQRFLKKERRQRLESRFHQHGFKLLVLARFLPPLRTGVFLIAGASKYSIWKFVLADVIYGIVGVGLFFLFGSFMIGLLDKIHHYLNYKNPWIYIVGFTITLAALWRYFKYQSARERAAAPQAPVSAAIQGVEGVMPDGEATTKPEAAPAAMAEAAKMFKE